MTATIYSFPHRHSGRRLEATSPNASTFTSDAEYRRRSVANLVVLTFLAAMVVAGFWIFSELTAAGRPGDCMQAHRGACGALTLTR